MKYINGLDSEHSDATCPKNEKVLWTCLSGFPKISVVTLYTSKDFCLRLYTDTGGVFDLPFSGLVKKGSTEGYKLGREEIDDLRAKLKVAEDALEKCKTAMCNYCRSTPEAKGLPCLNGCETLAIAKNALATIREEGGER